MGGGRGGGEVSGSDSSSVSQLSNFNDLQSSDGRKDQVMKFANKSGTTTEFSCFFDHSIPITVDEFDHVMEKRKSQNAYQKVLQSYHDGPSSEDVKKSVAVAKKQIRRYVPGRWMDSDDGEQLYYIPIRTTLLLVGPKGSGKSSLINRVSSLFKDWDKSPAPARAQVSTKSTKGGTQLVHGYTIPKRPSSVISLFDTPGLTGIDSCDKPLLWSWMSEGVFDEVSYTRKSEEHKYEEDDCRCRLVREVNFVIFVVSAVPVLRAISVGLEEDKQAMQMLAGIYNLQHLSFGDSKPVVVVTHGDLFSIEERARVRTHLGELFGIPPITQIFDIPESSGASTDLAILDMLKYSLEHADKNYKRAAPISDSDKIENLRREKPVALSSRSGKNENLQREKPIALSSRYGKIKNILEKNPNAHILFGLMLGLMYALILFGSPFKILELQSNTTLVHEGHGLDLSSKTQLNQTGNSDMLVNAESAPGGEKVASESISELSNHDQPTTITATKPSDEANQQQPDVEKEDRDRRVDQIQGRRKKQKHEKVRDGDSTKRPNFELVGEGQDEEDRATEWKRNGNPKQYEEVGDWQRNRNDKHYEEVGDWRRNGNRKQSEEVGDWRRNEDHKHSEEVGDWQRNENRKCSEEVWDWQRNEIASVLKKWGIGEGMEIASVLKKWGIGERMEIASVLKKWGIGERMEIASVLKKWGIGEGMEIASLLKKWRRNGDHKRSEEEEDWRRNGDHKRSEEKEDWRRNGDRNPSEEGEDWRRSGDCNPSEEGEDWRRSGCDRLWLVD